MLAVETISLEKTYNVGFWRKTKRQALKPLTLSIAEGEVFGFLGPNGAGKTTTLKLLMGLVMPTGGSARILGDPIGSSRVKAQIGYSPEQPYFYEYLTAMELLDYYATLSEVPARERTRRVGEVLSKVGLPDVGKLQLRKFSKGMLQRVSIAQSIIHDPKVVFLDEPMSGLDPMGRREVRDLIQELKEDGKTIFFSTHILSDAEVLCDRVAVLNKGELRGIGSIAELKRRTAGRCEIQWNGAPEALRGLAIESHSAAGQTRALVAEESVDRAVDLIRSARGRLLSVIPVHATLEDYFLEAVGNSVDEEVSR